MSLHRKSATAHLYMTLTISSISLTFTGNLQQQHLFNRPLSSAPTWVSRHQKKHIKPFRILMKQEMSGWQWHQMDHRQIICTSVQTDNHASTSSVNFQLGLPDAQPTVSKH